LSYKIENFNFVNLKEHVTNSPFDGDICMYAEFTG
jgi:hypothetical protein